MIPSGMSRERKRLQALTRAAERARKELQVRHMPCDDEDMDQDER